MRERYKRNGKRRLKNPAREGGILLINENTKRRVSSPYGAIPVFFIPMFERESSALDLTGTQATRADVHSLVLAVHNCLDLSDVGLPGTIGMTVGMGNVASEDDALSAEFTLCHFEFLHIYTVNYYEITVARVIIAQPIAKCNT